MARPEIELADEDRCIFHGPIIAARIIGVYDCDHMGIDESELL